MIRACDFITRIFSTRISKNGTIRKFHNGLGGVFSCSEEVISAREKGDPVVALESTIITHGMPYPDNLETALEVEDVIRQKVFKNPS